MSSSNRREFLMRAAQLAAALGLSPSCRLAAATPYNREFPDMLLSYLAGRLNALAANWDQERARIRTPAELEARNRYVRQKYLEMLGGFPERNPLNPRVVRVLKRDGYHIENVMFESRPNFWVTGNLYVPETGPGPFPAIISPCGHYMLARMQPDYQFVYLNLVKNGFIVLAYDPIGQGERRQYWNPQAGQTGLNLDPIYEHSIPGQLLLLFGENLTQYRVWDGVRAVDYLETRPEVDKNKIGCAGHSGGGTLTLFITPLEQRIKCAVINEGGTRRAWPMKIRPGSRVGPSDVEQNLFPSALYGVDRVDLHIAIAPRPLLTLIENYNPSFNEAAEEIRARHQLLSVPEKFATEEATDPHAWTVKLRLATTDWFSRWFYDRKGPDREPEFEPEPPQNLYCTPDGSIRYSREGDTIFSLILKKQQYLPPERKPPAGSQELEAFQGEITERIKSLLSYKYVEHPLGVRHVVTTQRKGYHVEKLQFLSEPGIYIPAWVFIPDGARGVLQTTLYVNESGKEADGREFGVLEELTRKGQLIVAVDVRGVGETRPPHSPSIQNPPEFALFFNVETAMSYMAWFMDQSLFGMRVLDVVRSLDYVQSRADADRANIRAIGKGMGALWVLYAAALDHRIRTAICDGGLLSYRSLTQVDRYLHGADVFIRSVLNHFDLPQVAAAMCDRHLALLSLLGPMKNQVEPDVARRTYQWTADTYANVRAADRFQLLPYAPLADPAGQYLEILQTT